MLAYTLCNALSFIYSDGLNHQKRKRQELVTEIKAIKTTATVISSDVLPDASYGDMIPRASMVETYIEVERLVDKILEITPRSLQIAQRSDKKLAVFITDKHNKNCFGRLRKDGATYDNVKVHLIMISTETLKLAPIEIAEAIIHAVGHTTNALLGVNDGTNNRHTKVFKDTLERMGMSVEKGTESQGYAITKATPELRQWITETLKPNLDAFRLRHIADVPKVKAPTKLLKWRCACPDMPSVRTVFMNARCEVCGEMYLLQD